MNDATRTTSSNGNRHALHPSRSRRRWAKASWLLGVATLALGACASADDASTDELLLGEHEDALTAERNTIADETSAAPPSVAEKRTGHDRLLVDENGEVIEAPRQPRKPPAPPPPPQDRLIEPDLL
jgi:hypothetical protein